VRRAGRTRMATRCEATERLSRSKQRVRRIFEAFVAGKSPRAIARGLNDDRVPGPSGKPWRDTTIRGHATRRTGILRNSIYIGRPEWNKQTYVRNPETGRRITRVRPAVEHIAVEVPTLCILEQALWDTAQARLEAIRQSSRHSGAENNHFCKERSSPRLRSKKEDDN